MMAALAQGTRAAGHDCVAAAYLEDGPVRASLEEAGISTRVLPPSAGLSLVLPWRIAAWLRAERADVLHTHHLGPALYGQVAARLVGIPMVHTEHSVEFYDVPRRRWLGAALDRVATVVAVSPEVAAWRERELGNACRVVENGVSLPPPAPAGLRGTMRASLGVGADAFVVGCVARLAPEKNHRLLLEAITAIPEAHLVLLGEGPERPLLERLVREQGLGARVHLLGARDDVARWWCAFDVAALTSTREGQPLALLEAMAAGVPVVATAVGGVPELLAQGAGELIEPGALAPLQAALLRLSHDVTARRRLAAAGLERVRARHSVEGMVSRYLELYRALAPEPLRRAS